MGVNFKTAPIEVREKLSRLVTIGPLEELQKEEEGRGTNASGETLLLSTCNRVEIYFATEDLETTRNLIAKLFRVESKDPDDHHRKEESASYQIYEYADEYAVQHLLSVASGLDSLIVGESQILLQVREACKIANEKKLCGPVLSKLFAKAYTTGKEIREAYPRFTNGFKNSVSLSVIQIIAEHFRDRHPNILLVGSGKMIKIAIGSLDSLSPNRVILASRRSSPGSSIKADKFIQTSEIARALVEDDIDVIITATTSEGYIITPRELEPLARSFSESESRKRKQGSGEQKLLIMDISVPRNVDPRIAEAYPAMVKLINLDDLKEIVADPHLEVDKSPERAAELKAIHRSIETRTNEFMFWLEESLDIAPIMTMLRKKADAIRREEFQNAISRLPDISPEERLVVERMSERIIRRFLYEPTTNLKKAVRSGESKRSREYASLLKTLFSLEED